MLCRRTTPPPRAHSYSRCKMIELSTTCVNRPAEQRMSPVALTEAIHSAARFEAAYTSGEYGRSALPVDAQTT